MTNADSLKAIVTALGGTPAGSTNTALLAEAVAALGGTPKGDSNDELIAGIAGAYAGATESLEAGNIKKGVTILGVTGTYEGGGGGSGAWALWDGTTAIADSDGNALYDVYFVLPVAGSSPAATVASMIPKGGALIVETYMTLVAGSFTADGICVSEAYIGDGDDVSGYTTAVAVGGDPPVAGTATGTVFTPAVGTNVLVYIRDSAGLPGQ